MRHTRDLTDEQWKTLDPLIPKPRRRRDRRGRPWKSRRSVLNGVLWPEEWIPAQGLSASAWCVLGTLICSTIGLSGRSCRLQGCNPVQLLPFSTSPCRVVSGYLAVHPKLCPDSYSGNSLSLSKGRLLAQNSPCHCPFIGKGFLPDQPAPVPAKTSSAPKAREAKRWWRRGT